MKYKPHDYQAYATNFILEHPISAVFLDMGLGKSVITLSAIFDLCLDYFSVRKVLVIAPLRVARDTWPTEIQKWDHLNGLSYSVAVGNEAERKAAMQDDEYLFTMFNYELANHEYSYTGDLDDTLDALGLTIEEINADPRMADALKRAIAVQEDC